VNLCSTSTVVQKVLVMASDRANMDVITQLIARRADWQLMTATNGQLGMELAVTCQPDVVVMDTTLSGVSAREVLAQLHVNPLTSHISVIALSGDASRAQIHAGLQAGFYRYLTKPYKLTDLLDAIDCALRYGLGNSEKVDTGLSA
jgi:CheY-like chemotaxis protein